MKKIIAKKHEHKYFSNINRKIETIVLNKVIQIS